MARRRGFTLIELLVVVAIVALLISILVPALSRAKDQAKRAKCQANLRSIGHAVLLYLGDYRDAFPTAQYYGCLGYVGRSPVHMYLGSQIPEDQRPMNGYFGVERLDLEGPQVNHQRNAIFECPSDRGDSWPAFNLHGQFYLEHGTSYTYASDSREINMPSQPPTVPPFGILSCRDLRLAEVRKPDRKIVFQEPVFSPMLNATDARSHWHYKGRPHGNVLFADGHVEFMFPRILEPYVLPNENEFYY